MTQEQIRQLEKDLWEAADELRANSKLTAAEYKDPVLGLVLLRFAQNRYEEAMPIVEQNLPINPRTGQKRTATLDDFSAAGAIMLPQEAQYEYLANLPTGSGDVASAIKTAMQQIEAAYPDLLGILPKNYHEFEKSLLESLIRVFNGDAVRKATGDVFGRIYEYFLMKFSMQGAGAQEGGEFFTPPSLVQLIVNFIEPDHGTIHDPACGSGGMFVQTGHFVRSHSNQSVNEAIKCYGTELKTNNHKLAKMNLAIHGIEGKIIEDNSFYSDPHKLIGQCDFVLANPPFNVNKIDKERDFVKTDPRLPFGIPKTDNGNYMWIQYFYAYLNQKGRAGFVMASSATDAGHSEALIRQKLVETGHVDCIVSISNNFFYTRSLPCHLWFFDKGKNPDNADKILMLDARNVFRKVTTTINDFSEGQLLNLTTIMKLYRGVPDACTVAEAEHQQMLYDNLLKVYEGYQILVKELDEVKTDLPLDWSFERVKAFEMPVNTEGVALIFKKLFLPTEAVAETVKQKQAFIKQTEEQITAKTLAEKEGKKQIQLLRSTITILNRLLDTFNKTTKEYAELIKQGIDDWQQLNAWFPDKNYRDTEGVCKIVSIEDVRNNDYSLTPGRYVGVNVVANADFDYKTRLAAIGQELTVLNQEAAVLAQQIENSIRELV